MRWLSSEAKFNRKLKYYKEWRFWFAWHPVRMSWRNGQVIPRKEREIVWLETIVRRLPDQSARRPYLWHYAEKTEPLVPAPVEAGSSSYYV